MTGGTRTRLIAVATAVLLVTTGFGALGGTVAADSGGNPSPTADPGVLAVSLTDGDGTANATYRVDEAAGTINASYAGEKADANVSYTDSATAIQFALDNATTENDTVVVGGGTFNGSVDAGGLSGVTLDGGYSRLNGSAGTGDTVDVTSDGATVRSLTVVYSPGTGIDSQSADNVTLRNVTATNNSKGVFADARAGPDLTLVDVTVQNNTDVGISLGPRSGTRVVDTVTANNTNAELLARSSTSNLAPPVGTLNGTNVTVGTTTFETVELKNVSVEGGATPPSLSGEPETVRVVGNLSGLDTGAFADVTVEYANTDTLGLNESGFEIGRYDSDGGSYVTATSTPDPAANTVTANLTGFGQTAILGDPEDGEGETVVDGTSTGTLDVNGTEVVDASINYTASRSGTATVSDLSSKPSSVPNATTSGGVEVDRVASYVSITAPEPTSGANATVEVTVNRSRLADPNDTQVWRYAGAESGYQPLATQVQSVTASGVRLTFETPGFSIFVVGDPVTDTGGNGGDGGSGVGSTIVAGEESVTQTLYGGTARRVTVEFDRATTGTVAVESVSGLPDAAPASDGRTVAAVDVSVPDDAANRSATVEITVPRAAVDGVGADPAALRVVKFDRGTDDLRRLDTSVVEADDETVVVAAETPGFSTFAVIALTDRTPRTTAGTTATRTATRTATPDGSRDTTGTTPPSTTETDTPEATPSPESTEGSGTGFGSLIAVVALLAAATATRRR